LSVTIAIDVTSLLTTMPLTTMPRIACATALICVKAMRD
jgi:hypothetical protein